MSVAEVSPTSITISRSLLKSATKREDICPPSQDIHARIRTFWETLPALRTTTPSLKAIKGRISGWIKPPADFKDQELEKLRNNLSNWVKAHDYNSIFSHAEELIYHCKPLFIELLGNDREFKKSIFRFSHLINPFLITVDTLLEHDSENVIRLFFEEDGFSTTHFEKFLSVGHPVIRLLSLKHKEQVYAFISDNDQVLDRVFLRHACQRPSGGVLEIMDNVGSALRTFSVELFELFLLQKAILLNDQPKIVVLAPRLGQNHISWLTLIPGVHKIFLSELGSTLIPLICSDSENMKEWAFYFPRPQIEAAVKEHLKGFDPVTIFRSASFVEELQLLTPLHFWKIAECRNPIVHEIMGYIPDYLEQGQLKVYLKGISTFHLHIFMKSLHPKNFGLVFHEFSKKHFEQYDQSIIELFFPRKFYITDAMISMIEKELERDRLKAGPILNGWIHPGLKELTSWLDNLKSLKPHTRKNFSSLISHLEMKRDRYETLRIEYGSEISQSMDGIALCPITSEPIGSPVRVHLGDRHFSPVYDKENLMQQRPLVAADSRIHFSYFSLHYDGNVGFEIKALQDQVFPKLKRGQPPQAKKFVGDE
jgi:hypothetical protein